MVGTLICPILFAIVPEKFLLSTAALLNGGSLILCYFAKNFWMFFIGRLVSGFFKVFMTIFFPVWIDIHAPKSSQAMWISIYFFLYPVGMVIGYASSLFLSKSYSW